MRNSKISNNFWGFGISLAALVVSIIVLAAVSVNDRCTMCIRPDRDGFAALPFEPSPVPVELTIFIRDNDSIEFVVSEVGSKTSGTPISYFHDVPDIAWKKIVVYLNGSYLFSYSSLNNELLSSYKLMHGAPFKTTEFRRANDNSGLHAVDYLLSIYGLQPDS